MPTLHAASLSHVICRELELVCERLRHHEAILSHLLDTLEPDDDSDDGLRPEGGLA